MKLLNSLRFLLAALVHRSKLDEEMEEELRAHIEHRADDLGRTGLARAEAERRARIEFGGFERFREESREAAGGTFLESIIADLRLAARLLRKSPGFAGVAVATLALGIGANAVVFGVLNALVLRPLDVPEAQSLFMLERASDHSGGQSYPDYADLRDRNRSFDGLAAYSMTAAGLDTGDNASTAWLYEVSGNYFDVFRVQPLLGRFFHGSDEHGPNSAPYIVLSYGYWHTHFQGDRGVLGRTVRLNKHPFTIIGVASPEFHPPVLFFTPDLFVPMLNQEQVDGSDYLTARGNRWVFMVMGHLRRGVSQPDAVADLNSIGSYMENSYPSDHGKMTFSLARPGWYGDFLGPPVRAFLGGMMTLAALILLAACANLGSLFGARAADRSREVALRLALGAGRVRILRQLFTEAVLISIVGGAAGLWGSVMLLRALSAWQPFPQFPIHVAVYPDANVYAVALLLTLASGFLFGAVPVRQVLRTNPYEVIKSGSARTLGRRFSVRDALLVVQIAICALLVTSSFVAVRGLARSLRGNFGIDPQNAMLADTDLGMAGYSGDQVRAMQERMIRAMESIPGVTSVGLVDWPPLTMSDWNTTNVFTDNAPDLRPAHAAAHPYILKTSPEYFRAAGTVLLSGRAFTWHDDKNSPRVAIVNKEFARRLFGSLENAGDSYFKLRDGTRLQVVGIVEDGKFMNLTEGNKPAVFLPLLQSPSNETRLIVRSTGDPQQLATAMRVKLRELDSELPSFIQTWSQAMDGALFPSRVGAGALGVLGVMGALLSITGIFALAAYSVSKRLRELGIRMALGAQRRELLQAALSRPFKLLALGSTAGLLLGILASRRVAFIVYQATPGDPFVLVSVILAMALLGVVATWIPAQRALSVDPVILLREE